MKRSDLEELNELFKDLDRINKDLQLIDNDCTSIHFKTKNNGFGVYEDCHPNAFKGIKEKVKEFYLEQREVVLNKIRSIDPELVSEYD